MSTRDENLKKAREKYAANVASGLGNAAPKNAVEQARADQTSNVKALRAYYWQHHSVVENQGNEAAQMLREDAERDYRAARERSLRPDIGLRAVINEVCWRCECGDDDPLYPVKAGQRIRDCTISHCALHPVRTKKTIERPVTLELP